MRTGPARHRPEPQLTRPPSPQRRDPHGCHARKVSGRHSDPSVHDRDPQSGPRRPAGAHRGHALAREGGRRRCVAGRAAGDDPGSRALLGDRARLAQVRGQAQLGAQLHHRDRRAGHPLRPRSLEARGRAAAHRLPRMARLVHRADEDRRPAHQPHRTRRERIGRLPPGDPQHAGLRVLGQADHDRVGPDPHGARLRRADEALGYERFVAAGGDYGALVVDYEMAGGRDAPSAPEPAPPELLGIHTNFPGGVFPLDVDTAIKTGGEQSPDLSADERRAASEHLGAGPTSMRRTPCRWGRARRRCTGSTTPPSPWPPT